MPSNIDAILVFIVPNFSKSVWFHLRSFLPTNLEANFYYKTPSENIFVFKEAVHKGVSTISAFTASLVPVWLG